MRQKIKDQMLITNIQRFSLHDGPGIRTTVFFKGCVLRCPWCSNPENLVSKKQKYVKDGVAGVYGKWYSSEELLKEIMKDKPFYTGVCFSALELLSDPKLLDRLPGGVTFSGGECLLQIDKAEDVLKTLRKEGIHMAVETCLFVSPIQLNIALKYIDLFLVDLKILNGEKCSSILHGELKSYLKNINTLMDSGKPIVIRVPVIGGYTDGKENRKAISEFLRKYRDKIIKVELIKGHDLGINKYRSLIDGGNNVSIPAYKGVTGELMELYKKEIIESTGLCTGICTI